MALFSTSSNAQCLSLSSLINVNIFSVGVHSGLVCTSDQTRLLELLTSLSQKMMNAQRVCL